MTAIACELLGQTKSNPVAAPICNNGTLAYVGLTLQDLRQQAK